MGRPIFAVGIPVPNGNFEYKSDGQGPAGGFPDGWQPTGRWLFDLVAPTKMKTLWTQLRRGSNLYPRAMNHASRGRAFSVSLSDLASIDATRYIDSASTAAGYAWGVEALDPLGTTQDFWYLRLRFWWRGLGVAPGASAAWAVQLWGVSTPGTTSTMLVSIPLDGVNDWNATQGDVVKVSAAVKLTTETARFFVRIVADRGVAGWATGVFSDISIETLGPADSAAVTSGIEASNGTFAEEGVGGTYYQLTKTHNYSGYKVTPIRFGKATRLPSGAYRWADPSGGAMRRRFTVPLSLIPWKDYQKLYRLWLVNKGQTQDLQSYYGTAFPILFSPQASDDVGFYYVAFEGTDFPLEPDGGFMAGTEFGQLYRGVLSLVEV